MLKKLGLIDDDDNIFEDFFDSIKTLIIELQMINENSNNKDFFESIEKFY